MSANSVALKSNKSYNFAGYKKLYIEFGVGSSVTHYASCITLKRDSINGNRVDEYDNETDGDIEGVRTISFDLTKVQTTFKPYIRVELHGGVVQIKRIYIE